MVTVVVIRSSPGYIVGFNASGHAEAGPYGSDLVCCAVSALTQAAIIGLQGVVEAPLLVKKDSGQLHCRLELKSITKKQIEQAQVILETMVLALRDLAATYGEHVTIHEKMQ